MSESESQAYARRQGLADLIYFAREFCGFTESKLEWKDEHGVRHKVKKEGPDYGISRLGPHEKMAALFQSPSQAKYLSYPRDGYKTTGAECFGAQTICANHDFRLLYSQVTKREALKKCAVIAKMVNSPKVQETYGVELVQEDDVWVAKNRSPFITDPTLEAGGLDSELTGSHRDGIILDDPVTWLNVRNPDGIKKTRAYFDQLQPLLDPMGWLLVIATMYDYADLSHDIIKTMSDEFEILITDCGMTPIRKPGEPWQLVGTPRFKHLTEDYLLSRLRRMGYQRFMANYCLRIAHDEFQQFRRTDFRSRIYTQSLARCVRGYVMTDTAVSTKDTACQRVVAVVGLDSNDCAYLFDLRVGRWPSQMIPLHVCDLIAKWQGEGLKLAGVCLEAVSLNQPFYAMIEREQQSRGQHVRIIQTPRTIHQDKKEQRIAGMGLRFEQGRFVVCSSVPAHFDDAGSPMVLWNPEGWTEEGVKMPAGELVDQFIRLGTYPRNDIADALADLDVCDNDGRRILRGAGIPPRDTSWTGQGNKAVQDLLRRIQEGDGTTPPLPQQRRRAGDRWRHLPPTG